MRKTRTLRHLLNTTATQSTFSCSMSNCPLQNNSLCFRKNVVYQITCDHCQQFYIGSTCRHLHIRIKEHYTTNKSSIFQHRTQCKSTFTTKIIANDHDATNLRLREALLIKKLKPKINSRVEMEQFRDFLFC